jgi:hypothetical protein
MVHGHPDASGFTSGAIEHAPLGPLRQIRCPERESERVFQHPTPFYGGRLRLKERFANCMYLI